MGARGEGRGQTNKLAFCCRLWGITNLSLLLRRPNVILYSLSVAVMLRHLLPFGSFTGTVHPDERRPSEARQCGSSRRYTYSAPSTVSTSSCAALH